MYPQVRAIFSVARGGPAAFSEALSLWDWYSALPEHDKTLVMQAMRISAYGALFGVFALVDGVRQVDDPPHGELRLTYVSPDGTEHPLGGPGPDLDELHSLWAAEVFPYTEPAGGGNPES